MKSTQEILAALAEGKIGIEDAEKELRALSLAQVGKIGMIDLNAFHTRLDRLSDHGEAFRRALMAQAKHHVCFRHQFQDFFHLRYHVSFIIDD